MIPAFLAVGFLLYGGKKTLDFLTAVPARPAVGPPLAPQKTAAITPADAAIEGDSEAERADIDRNLKASLASLGLAAAGRLFFPPLTVFGAAGLIYIAISDAKKARAAWRKEKKIGIEAITLVVTSGLLLAGYIVAAASAFLFYFIGQKLLFTAADHSRKNLVRIFADHQQNVWLVRDGCVVEIPLTALKPGDVISVKAGEMIPADGVVTTGTAAVDQQVLTGESAPSEKGTGDPVFAATLLLAGRLWVQVEKSGTSTLVAQIEEVLKRTVGFKTQIQSLGEELSAQAIPPTLGASAVALLVAGPLGSLAVLYSFIGYDIRIFAPLSVLSFMKAAAKGGILIKDGRALELLSRVDTVVFDKTGTLTLAQPQVWQVHPCRGHEEGDVLRYAAIAENRQTHPIAKAILRCAKERGIDSFPHDDVSCDLGYGIRVRTDVELIHVGSARFMHKEGIGIPVEMEERIARCHFQGYSLVLVARNECLAGAIELQATVRPEAEAIIRQLKQRGKQILIISGDHEQITKTIAGRLGIEQYFSGAIPEEKANIVSRLQREGRNVCFIGDGINDAIAMRKACVSVSLGGASQVATDTADIVLLDGSLRHVDRLFDLAEDTKKNLRTAMAAAIIPGGVAIGSVFLLHSGIISSMAVNCAGLLVGITNGYLPLTKHGRVQSPSLLSS